MTHPSGAPSVHPDLAKLSGLLGTWRGTGEGDYPTIEEFDYSEEVTFSHVGKPFLAYSQKTRRVVNGKPAEPLHAEAGYLRPGGGTPEFVIAQPTGITEVYEHVEDPKWTRDLPKSVDLVLDLRTQSIGLSRTALPVTEVRRRFVLDGDTLAYDMWMAYDETKLTHHLRAVLRRV